MHLLASARALPAPCIRSPRPALHTLLKPFLRSPRPDPHSASARLGPPHTLPPLASVCPRAAPFLRSPLHASFPDFARIPSARHCTAPHRTAPHRTARHRTARHGTAPHRTARHGTARYRTARHGTAPSGSWRGGDCAGGAATAPIAPAVHAIGGTATALGARRAEARCGADLGERRQGAGLAEAS